MPRYGKYSYLFAPYIHKDTALPPPQRLRSAFAICLQPHKRSNLREPHVLRLSRTGPNARQLRGASERFRTDGQAYVPPGQLCKAGKGGHCGSQQGRYGQIRGSRLQESAGNAGRQPGRHGRQTVRPLLCRTRRGRLRGIHELCPRRRAAKPFCGGGNIRHARRTQELGEHTQRPALGGDIRPLRGRTRVFRQQAEQAKPYSKFLKNHYFGHKYDKQAGHL